MRNIFSIFFIVSFLIVPECLVKATSVSNSTGNITVSCENEHNFDDIELSSVLGEWGVVEVYMHITDEGVKQYYNCPRVKLWEIQPRNELSHHVQAINAKFRQDYRNLRLLWNEAGQMLEYSLFFRNDSAGYWQVAGGQNGSLATNQNYQQFSGTIQVLNFVNDHLLLNFCQESTNNRPMQLYSVLFSRDPGMISRWDVESVHSLLQNRQLSIASRRKVCGNSAYRLNVGLLTIITCILSYMICKF